MLFLESIESLFEISKSRVSFVRRQVNHVAIIRVIIFEKKKLEKSDLGFGKK